MYMCPWVWLHRADENRDVANSESDNVHSRALHLRVRTECDWGKNQEAARVQMSGSEFNGIEVRVEEGGGSTAVQGLEFAAITRMSFFCVCHSLGWDIVNNPESTHCRTWMSWTVLKRFEFHFSSRWFRIPLPSAFLHHHGHLHDLETISSLKRHFI
jgi:hypothetical protein